MQLCDQFLLLLFYRSFPSTKLFLFLRTRFWQTVGFQETPANRLHGWSPLQCPEIRQSAHRRRRDCVHRQWGETRRTLWCCTRSPSSLATSSSCQTSGSREKPGCLIPLCLVLYSLERPPLCSLVWQRSHTPHAAFLQHSFPTLTDLLTHLCATYCNLCTLRDSTHALLATECACPLQPRAPCDGIGHWSFGRW